MGRRRDWPRWLGRKIARLAWLVAYVGAALGLGALAYGCARFTPNMPMRARSGDVELQIRSLSLGPKRELVFESRSTVPHTIRQAWLTVATRDPCSGGAEVEEVMVDGIAEAGGLAPGAHELTMRFSDTLNGYVLDVVVDMIIDDGACVRAPAVSQIIGMTAEKRSVIIAGTGLSGNSDLGGLAAIMDVRAGGGRWLGPMLITGEFGAGQSLCNFGSCGRRVDGGRHSGLALSLTLEGRWCFAEGFMSRLANAGLIGARYGLASVQLPTVSGDRRFTVHAVQGVLAWQFGDALAGPFHHISRALPFEIAFPIGVLIDPEAPNHRVVFAAAMEMRFFFHL